MNADGPRATGYRRRHLSARAVQAAIPWAPRYHYNMLALLRSALLAAASASVAAASSRAVDDTSVPATRPVPPQYDNLTTTSIFWPNETAADGTVFACTCA
jgi:hypothetical protein